MARRPRTFRSGEILRVEEVVRLILTGHWTMRWGRPTHPAWLMNNSIAVLRMFVIHRAIVTEAYRLPPPRLFEPQEWRLVNGQWTAPNIEGWRP